MTDSSSFSSLFDLVDSHLSKTEVQNSESGNNSLTGSIPIPSLHGVQRGMSDTRLGFPLRIPRFSTSESPITSVLSEQLSNMFKAQELKKQQELERQRLQEEMKKLKLEEDNCLIDLMKAVQRPGQSLTRNEETLSRSSSCESLLLENSEFVIGSPNLKKEVVIPSPEPLLPCKTDMRYILKQKVKRGKCSEFGKVLTSRLRPVAAPYLREPVIETSIKRFDFSTKSPCDLIKEKLRKPSSYSQSEDPITALFNMV